MRRGTYANITQRPSGDYALDSSYDPGLVATLKAMIPSTDRRWDGVNKRWLFTEMHLDAMVDIVSDTLGIIPHVQTALPQKPQQETRLIRLEYLGTAKDRGGSEPVAFGFADGDWSVAFPVSILRQWFEIDAQTRPDEGVTLYGILGISKTADAAAIKSAYRRMARQWHPDVCKEPDAESQFKQINNAYGILSDELMRKKYDAGLRMEAGVSRMQRPVISTYGWRSPLRCGWVLVEGMMQLGRFHVSKIIQWEDVTDDQGRVMVSSWPPGGDRFQVQWV